MIPATHMPSHHAEDIIAKAIQKSDRSVFFENYNQQAKAVVTSLRKAGLVIVPQQPSDATLQEAASILREGRHRPRDIITALYKKFIEPFV